MEVESDFSGGRKPTQVFLTKKGAAEVAARHKRVYQHGVTARQAYEHALGAAGFFAHASSSDRERGIDVLWQRHIMSASPDGASPRGWALDVHHAGKHYEQLSIQHAGMFAPKLRDQEPRLFLLEYDRGTEQFQFESFHRSTIARKLVLYYESSRQWSLRDKAESQGASLARHLKHPYDLQYPQVLFVVDSKDPAKRIANIQRKAAEHGIAQGAANLFLFVAAEDLLKENLFDAEWTNLKGKPKRPI